MKTPRILCVVLVAWILGAGFATAQSVSDDKTIDNTRPAVRGSVASDEMVNGVKLRGDGSVDDRRPGVADDIGLGETLGAKLARLDRQRARREAQLASALAGLAADDPKRAAIIARFERKFAELEARRARLEARGGDAGVDAAGREDRRAERPADSHADHPERQARVERAERLERAQRPERSGKAN